MPKKDITLKRIDYSEAWYRVWRPYCDEDNYFCNGNESDLSGLDIDAVKRYNCNKVFLLGPADPIMDEIRGDDYELMIKDGVNLINA